MFELFFRFLKGKFGIRLIKVLFKINGMNKIIVLLGFDVNFRIKLKF